MAKWELCIMSRSTKLYATQTHTPQELLDEMLPKATGEGGGAQICKHARLLNQPPAWCLLRSAGHLYYCESCLQPLHLSGGKALTPQCIARREAARAVHALRTLITATLACSHRPRGAC